MTSPVLDPSKLVESDPPPTAEKRRRGRPKASKDKVPRKGLDGLTGKERQIKRLGGVLPPVEPVEPKPPSVAMRPDDLDETPGVILSSGTVPITVIVDPMNPVISHNDTIKLPIETIGHNDTIKLPIETIIDPPKSPTPGASSASTEATGVDTTSHRPNKFWWLLRQR